MKKIFVVLNLLLLMIVFGYSVIKEEKNLKKATFYIKTVPVDPRSLIQGDYMVLNYDIAASARMEIGNIRKGYIRIKINDLKIAEFIRIDEEYLPPSNNEISIQFQKNGSNIDIGVNSYLFQEGTGNKFQKAQYAEVIELKNGKLRLKNLLDKDFIKIK
ncbi:MAG: GDYXXLXY domain-containing protein [Fusobacterium varium]|uniref:GDYXXLXY domain-containing protein n=1 Tax=Fusobacterium varium TaxID=856 RepID=UPI00242DED1F|nr:GDYXXLXY domain-containing protein [Fusobacterium varium]UYI78420.1 MAG: GDYXXLXY domain-containing protein [Fusobacterium varium]